MANQILIKRGTGTSALANGELGFNTSTNTLYIGNNGNKAIGGSGAFLPLSGGTMTGDLIITTGLAVLVGHKYPSTTLKTTMDDRSISYGAAIAENTMYGQVIYNDGKGNNEYYMFPDRTSEETGNAWHSILTSKKPVTIAQGGTGLTKAGEVQSLFMNSFKVTRDDIKIEETDVLSLPTGIYHHEETTSLDNNYPIAATRAMIEVIGQQREGTAAPDGYPNGYWAVRVTYPYSGEQYWNHRTWSTWTGWRKIYNTSNKDTDAVQKSGDTMTGTLYVPYLRIYNSDNWIGVDLFSRDNKYRAGFSCDESNRVFIRQKGVNAEDGEYYHLPLITTSGYWYEILTSKNPVTVAQGGTGATTAEQARKNLAVPYYAKYDAGNLQTGAGNGSAWITYYGDDGTSYNQMDLGKTATSFYKPVNIASGGTGATSASGACTNLGAVKKSGDAMTGQLSISHNSFHTLKLIASSSNTAKEASIGFFQDTTEAWTLGVATGSNGTTDFGLYAAGHGLAFKVGKASSDPITLYRHLNSTTSGNFGNSLQVGSNAKRQVLLYSGDDHAKISNQDASWFEYNAMYMYDTHTYFKKPIQVLTQQYWIEGKYGVNMDNSDIINANGIYFTDDSNAAGEGINFFRSSTTWDTLVASGGKLYFAPNRATSEVGTRYEVYHSGGSVVPVSKGGTGATTASGARANLGALSNAGDTASGGYTLNGALTIQNTSTQKITLNNTNTNGESSIGFNNAGVLKWVCGIGCGGSGNTFALWNNNLGRNDITVDNSNGKVVLTGPLNIGGTSDITGITYSGSTPVGRAGHIWLKPIS